MTQVAAAQRVTSNDPRPRVIVLGASNVARGISPIVETARQMLGPAEYHVALGHGRSYALGTTMFGRWLPGILQCGLWERLAARPSASPSAPTYALVTDIGNDILYDVPVDTIIGWVRDCVDRLAAVGARGIVTELPVVNLPQLGARRFAVLRRAFFPRCRLSLEEVVARSFAVNSEVCRAAAEKKFFAAAVSAQWYGFDPIHIRRTCFARAWPELLSSWVDEEPRDVRMRPSLRRWVYLHSRVPQHRAWWRFEQRGAQPCGRLHDGSSLFWY